MSPASSRTSSLNKRLGLFAVRRLPVLNADTPAALTRSPTDFWGVSARLQEQEVLDSTKQPKKGSRPAPSGPSCHPASWAGLGSHAACKFASSPGRHLSNRVDPPGPVKLGNSGKLWAHRTSPNNVTKQFCQCERRDCGPH